MKPLKPLTSWLEVDEAIKQLGRIQIERDAKEGAMNKSITKLKESYGMKIDRLDDMAEAVEAALEKWCEAHRDDMAVVKKSGGLTWRGAFGKVAFRKCPPSVSFTKKNMAAILAALKSRKLFNCIRTVEEPNKDAMVLLDKQTLREVGAKVGAEEKFEIKPDYTVIQSTPTGRPS
ncbi:host-nuclease inhibitor Gam family protein [Candidatus Nitronereus thalassa]|uniref:Host-nuclease inhibitor Gam family protein n=1 Tax=Candidatus Nitronereus thalassa TaxID=3020898 RepID=A0ABU3K373_9BACT|nr:host-nuclease inhibitor Gam family protein [Candidatus Nitronereus thalassa]MDT7040843.1 host-nuclease inhibitor Gam family protein [Candidatus Nitronereus thalassa]